ncbi:MAG: hypothetical protein Q9225_001248 [Loekoesia sp. 1 TL-2023]
MVLELLQAPLPELLRLENDLRVAALVSWWEKRERKRSAYMANQMAMSCRVVGGGDGMIKGHAGLGAGVGMESEMATRDRDAGVRTRIQQGGNTAASQQQQPSEIPPMGGQNGGLLVGEGKMASGGGMMCTACADGAGTAGGRQIDPSPTRRTSMGGDAGESGSGGQVERESPWEEIGRQWARPMEW